MRIYENNSLAFGNTPLVKLNRMTADCKAEIVVKVEGRNPGYSVKCRIGAAMILDAEQKGLLRPGMEIIEPTSGNTGIALAYVAAAKGYKLTLSMPESMSMERRKILRAFGAHLILTDSAKGMKGAIDKALEFKAANPDHIYLPQQFENPSNPLVHEKTTGPEIYRDTDGSVDAVIAGVGTGGTITGIARYLKETVKKKCMIVAVEPESSPVLTQALKNEPLTPGPHMIQGIGAGFVPPVMDLKLIDRVEAISNDEAIEMALRLTREEGIISGISSGAAVAAALRIAKLPEMAGKRIVAILPDSGERYLSSILFKDILENG